MERDWKSSLIRLNRNVQCYIGLVYQWRIHHCFSVIMYSVGDVNEILFGFLLLSNRCFNLGGGGYVHNMLTVQLCASQLVGF